MFTPPRYLVANFYSNMTIYLWFVRRQHTIFTEWRQTSQTTHGSIVSKWVSYDINAAKRLECCWSYRHMAAKIDTGRAKRDKRCMVKLGDFPCRWPKYEFHERIFLQLFLQKIIAALVIYFVHGYGTKSVLNIRLTQLYPMKLCVDLI